MNANSPKKMELVEIAQIMKEGWKIENHVAQINVVDCNS
jgi:hypothetical protein